MLTPTFILLVIALTLTVVYLVQTNNYRSTLPWAVLLTDIALLLAASTK